jgi:hypothetical protein
MPVLDTGCSYLERQETKMGFLQKLFGGMPGRDDHAAEVAAAPEGHDHDHDHDHGDADHTHDEPAGEDTNA